MASPKEETGGKNMKYCINCKRTVEPIKRFNWGAFIIGFLLFVIPAIVYLLWFMVADIGRCPMCNAQNWGASQKISRPKNKKPEKSDLDKSLEGI